MKSEKIVEREFEASMTLDGREYRIDDETLDEIAIRITFIESGLSKVQKRKIGKMVFEKMIEMRLPKKGRIK